MSQNSSLNEELYDRIEEHLDRGNFEKGTPAYGIAMKVAQEGLFSLSAAQRVIYEKVSLPILSQPLKDEESLRDALEQDWEDEDRSRSAPPIR